MRRPSKEFPWSWRLAWWSTLGAPLGRRVWWTLRGRVRFAAWQVCQRMLPEPVEWDAGRDVYWFGDICWSGHLLRGRWLSGVFLIDNGHDGQPVFSRLADSVQEFQRNCLAKRDVVEEFLDSPEGPKET